MVPSLQNTREGESEYSASRLLKIFWHLASTGCRLARPGNPEGEGLISFLFSACNAFLVVRKKKQGKKNRKRKTQQRQLPLQVQLEFRWEGGRYAPIAARPYSKLGVEEVTLPNKPWKAVDNVKIQGNPRA